ncbi:E3 ubiquitin-protein ligase RNF182 [Siphateles boraxobius]|uniref:E3 ubiquitin-protein ligase RNF182 n=1 Tax=Siphateles boraxobius TaxID=180520 RepID=UPI00406300F7
MVPETECGICYRTYNVSRRCPRHLSCKHSFCESCLLTLARSAESLVTVPRIVCPLCRHSTSLSVERVQDNLPVDEDIFERITARNSEECTDDDDDDDTDEPERDASSPAKEDASPPPAPTSRKGHLMKLIRRMCKRVTGDRVRRNCLTNEDMRDLAMMSCYMM